MASGWRIYRTPVLLGLFWLLLVLLLFHWVVWRENTYAKELARIQTETLFASIVNTRGWNAENGGVWIEENPNCPPNPWIPEALRTAETVDGKHLVKVNPAAMTRQMATREVSPLMYFRISGLRPMRPGNTPDLWESGALTAFEAGEAIRFELTEEEQGLFYRFMAPLEARRDCLLCHADNQEGDILGGLSVSIPAEPLLSAAHERKQTAALAFGLVGLVGVLGIGGATLQINQKRELAEAANRTKSAFLANMTHDMRTPLAGMLGMCELLQREIASPRQRYLLSHLQQASDSLLTVVDGIMRYALLEVNGVRANLAPMSLRHELDQCVAPFRPACTARGVTLNLCIEPSVPDSLEGDAFRLRQALGNVLGNAVKFTTSGSITLTVEHTPKANERCLIHFRVQDTGCGIVPEEQKRIFERFEQGSAGPSDEHASRQDGMGLGLAISQSIARGFGGDLLLESSSEQGSVFVLSLSFGILPVAPEVPAAVLEKMEYLSESPRDTICLKPEAQTSLQRPKRLLVAEDSPVNAVFLQEILDQAGYEPHMAGSGQDALDIMATRAPDAVLLDLHLPDMTGLDIAAAIRSGSAGINPDTPILLLTASMLTSKEGCPLPVNRCLRKPVTAETLLAALTTLFAAHQETAPVPQSPSEPVHAESGELPVFDAAGALEDMDGNQRLLHQLCGIFLTEAPEFTAVLQDFQQKDAPLDTHGCDTIRRLAHRLVNSAGALHLLRLREVAADLEQQSLAGVPYLHHELEKTQRTLKEALAALACKHGEAYGSNTGC